MCAPRRIACELSAANMRRGMPQSAFSPGPAEAPLAKHFQRFARLRAAGDAGDSIRAATAAADLYNFFFNAPDAQFNVARFSHRMPSEPHAIETGFRPLVGF